MKMKFACFGKSPRYSVSEDLPNTEPSTMVPRPVCPSPDAPLIPQFYAGRSIFITGATGFMGKVLIERLLWTCPDVGRLLLLMREKKDVSPEKRLANLKESQVFDVVRSHCPHQLDKLQIVAGDTTLPNLGMDAHSINQLREVSIVFHSAATVKFDESLNVAMDLNVRSVMRLMDICDKLPNIDAFIYVSTGYSNAELSVVEERVYPLPAHTMLSRALSLAEALPKEMLAKVTPEYISPKPNTYTFTKALAETAVVEHTTRTYPVSIYRPTIVVSALQHPYPGWIENLNGPSGVIVGTGKGLLHVFSCRHSARADLMPVDIAIDTLLAAAWETATDNSPDVKVYNCSTTENPTTWGNFQETMFHSLRVHPLNNIFWYPSGFGVANPFARKLMEFLVQTLPLHLAHYAVRLFGIKTKLNLITVSQRLVAMNEVLHYFSIREWRFKTDNVQKLQARLTPQDAAIYNLDPHSISWDEHCENFVKGTRKYLLKEEDQDLDKAKRHLRKMKFIHNGLLFFVLMLLCRIPLRNPQVRIVVYGFPRFILGLFFTTISTMKKTFFLIALPVNCVCN